MNCCKPILYFEQKYTVPLYLRKELSQFIVILTARGGCSLYWLLTWSRQRCVSNCYSSTVTTAICCIVFKTIGLLVFVVYMKTLSTNAFVPWFEAVYSFILWVVITEGCMGEEFCTFKGVGKWRRRGMEVFVGETWKRDLRVQGQEIACECIFFKGS